MSPLLTCIACRSGEGPQPPSRPPGTQSTEHEATRPPRNRGQRCSPLHTSPWQEGSRSRGNTPCMALATVGIWPLEHPQRPTTLCMEMSVAAISLPVQPSHSSNAVLSTVPSLQCFHRPPVRLLSRLLVRLLLRPPHCPLLRSSEPSSERQRNSGSKSENKSSGSRTSL